MNNDINSTNPQADVSAQPFVDQNSQGDANRPAPAAAVTEVNDNPFNPDVAAVDPKPFDAPQINEPENPQAKAVLPLTDGPTTEVPVEEPQPAEVAPQQTAEVTNRGTVVINGQEYQLQAVPQTVGITSDGHCKLLDGDGPVVPANADLADADGLVRQASVKVVQDPYKCGTCGVIRERYEFPNGQCPIAVRQGKADEASPAQRVISVAAEEPAEDVDDNG